MRSLYHLPCLLFLVVISSASNAQQPVHSAGKFTIYKDKVVQGKFEAKALSATQITSNYVSPANEYQSSAISFKFAINGRDNEMPSGQDHHFTVSATNGMAETPVIVFGKQLNTVPGKNSFLAPNTKLTIKVDMKEVLKQFSEKGFYTAFNGTKIYREDFKGLYIAGGTAPMIWDFDNLVHHDNLQLKDPDGDGIYETTLILNAKEDQKQTDAAWNLSKDISAFPQYQSDNVLANALYNMSIEEMIKAVEPDSTFRTGKEWAGVWTRDISYSIILSMAYLQPQVAKYSLLRKVNKKKRIIQDTGTGGAYPASTDRMIWAVAAWEVYKATGDKDWLQLVYEIIKNSIGDDMHNAYDPVTGLVRGESSFLDWREETYPKWMQPADIFESECLGTNAVHYQANIVLGEMAKLLHEEKVAVAHAAIAKKIKDGINTYLWVPSKGYYGQFLYGRNYKIVSPRSEALGEALCILFGIADEKRSRQIIASVPVTDYGISCIYPQIPNIPPYHNNAVWPFVQSYWALAAAKTGNTASLSESISDIRRPAALFLTNKENFVADNGDFAGTQINSSNMLWSLSGNIAMIHRIFFGIGFEADGLRFHPVIPREFPGKHTLTNFKYRNAVLDIEIEGTGDSIGRFSVDEKIQSKAWLPADIKGKHSVKIKMASKPFILWVYHRTNNYFSPAAPIVHVESNMLVWDKLPGDISFIILKNGKQLATTVAASYAISTSDYAEYQVMAVDNKGVASFASEPVAVPGNNQTVYEVEDYNTPSDFPCKGFMGKGFTETNKTINTPVTMPVEIPVTGTYAIDFRYANGNGPTNTENKCAIRSLWVNGKEKGTIVLPQRGVKEWSNWGYSNSVVVHLEKGKHTITLQLEDYNDNMNGEINQAMLDNMRVTRLQ